MDSLAMLLFPLMLVAKASAAGLRDFNATTLQDPPTPIVNTPFSQLLNIIKIFGLANTDTRQAETAIFSQLLTSFVGLMATGKVVPYLAPVAVTYLVMPLMKLLKAAAKGFFFLGVIGWLVDSIVPAFLTYLGLAGLGASTFMARAIPSSSPLAQFVGVDPSFLTTKGLQYLNMDNEECRVVLSCKAGEFIVDNYPTATNLIARSGLLSFFQTQTGNGASPYTSIALEAAQGQVSCSKLAPCNGIQSIESILDLRPTPTTSDNGNITTTDAPSTTTPLPTTFPSQNDFVVGAIKRLAQNYYNYNATNWYNMMA